MALRDERGQECGRGRTRSIGGILGPRPIAGQGLTRRDALEHQAIKVRRSRRRDFVDALDNDEVVQRQVREIRAVKDNGKAEEPFPLHQVSRLVATEVEQPPVVALMMPIWVLTGKPSTVWMATSTVACWARTLLTQCFGRRKRFGSTNAS